MTEDLFSFIEFRNTAGCFLSSSFYKLDLLLYLHIN